MAVKYYINGVDFKTDGVGVSGSKGLLDLPKRKDVQAQQWPDLHGEVADLAKPVFDVREITLECWLAAADRGTFATLANTFLQRFAGAGTQRLMVEADSSKPLVYEVYAKDGVAVNKRWRNGRMSGTFSLKLREPEPVKRVVKFTSSSGSITLTTANPVNIYWGDGTNTQGVAGTAVVSAKNFGTSGTRYAIVTGNIDDITAFSTTGTIVWSKL